MATEQYTLKDYLGALRRRSALFMGIFAVVTATAVAFAFLPPDEYRASAEMRIDMQGPNVNLLKPIELTNYADQYIKTLQQQVMTHENLQRWVEESNAYWYEADATPGELVRRLRDEIAVQMVFTTVIEEETGKEVDLITGFTTAFSARDPQAAEVVAREVANAFLAADRDTRVQKAAAAASFLREQIEAKRKEMLELESEIARFKREHAGSLPDLMVLNMTALERVERDLEQVQREVRTLRQDRFFREAQLQEIKAEAGVAGTRLVELEQEYLRAVGLYGPEHPDVIRLKRQIAALTGTGESGSELARLQAELAAAQERYSDEHPDVISLKRKIEALQTTGAGQTMTDPLYLQLRAQINAIDSNIASLEARAEELRQQRADLQDRISRMPEVEREFQVLQREHQTATLAFDELRQRLAQAQQIESFESGERGARLTLVREARAPEAPTGPPRIAITILGLFVATSLAGGAAFVSEITDSRIRGSKDIQVVLNTHAIATVPIVQNSLYRAQKRRQFLVVGFSALMLGAIIFLVVGAITS